MKLNRSKCWSFMLGAFLAAGLTASAPALAVDGNGVQVDLFELDGDAEDMGGLNNIMRDDWETLWDDCGHAGGTGICGNADVFTGILPDQDGMVMPHRVYTGGGSKDIKDLSPGGETGNSVWLHKEGSTPDKNELTNAYAAAYLKQGDGSTVGNAGEACWDNDTSTVVDCGSVAADEPLHRDGDQIFYFGADRFANTGDAFLGFWFFQQQIGLSDTKRGGGFEFTGKHQVGDVLVLVEYPQGSNAQPIVKVYEWNPAEADVADNLKVLFDAGEANCDGDGGKIVCAITNDEVDGLGLDIGAVPSPWPYMPKSGPNDIFPHESFFEGGINISRVLGGSRCFSSFLAETRSSASETAELKDFVLGQFAVCGIEPKKFCDADFSATAGALDVDINGYVENTGLLPLEVTLSDDKGDITEVCLYTGAGTPSDSEVCDGTDDTPLAHNISNGVAVFTVPAGKFAIYEGFYLETNPTFNSETGMFELTDTVTAVATEVGETAVIADLDATANCELAGLAKITINKNCTATGISGGDTANFDITGGGMNDGDVKLVNVSLSDMVLVPASGGGTLQNLVVMVNGSPVSQPFDLNAGDSYTFSGEISHTNSLQHQDKMTVTATNPFTNATLTEMATSPLCQNAANPDIEVTKNCEVFLDADDTPGRIVVGIRIDGVVTNTGNVDLINVTVIDQDITEVNPLVDNVTLQSGGGSQSYMATYYPSGTGEPPAGSLGFTDTVLASGTAVLGGGQPTATATAEECFLCPQDN